MKLPIDEAKIPEQDKNATVELLLEVVHHQAAYIQQLEDEIARLKKHPPRPKIKPSSLNEEKNQDQDESSDGADKKKKKSKKRPGSKKRKKTAELTVHQTIDVPVESVPENSRFKGYKEFVVQGIKFCAHNVKYRLETYVTAEGQYICAQLPENLGGKHFSPELIAFAIYQHHHCHVTRPLLLKQLQEIGIDISAGTLNNILIENKDEFHQEKDRVLSAGLEISPYINVDDTGARHQGQNGYCTLIGSPQFSWFESTVSKSRINFLSLLRAGYTDFVINAEAIAYAKDNKLPKVALEPLMANCPITFDDQSQWDDFLAQNQIVKPRHIKIATEAALLGAIIEHGISDKLVIISDDAGQFNVLCHALCWIHANRAIDKVQAFTEPAKQDLARVKDQIWQLYRGLKDYKQNPNDHDKAKLENMFDDIFTQKTASPTLNEALKRIYRNKAELLLVLQRPDIPTHNNDAESAIREYVKKRKISGSTRSQAGRKCRDTFTSLKQTSRKLGIPFWQYLLDRLLGRNEIPDLAELMRLQAQSSG